MVTEDVVRRLLVKEVLDVAGDYTTDDERSEERRHL